jgi:hypothetical protein
MGMDRCAGRPAGPRRNLLAKSDVKKIYLFQYVKVTSGKQRPAPGFPLSRTTPKIQPSKYQQQAAAPGHTGLFSRIKSLYFITLGETLRRIEPKQFANLMIEQEWFEEPRQLSERHRQL